MSLANAIRRAIPVLAQHGHVEPGILAAWLLHAGLSKKEAHDAIRFIPLAFGREVLEGTGVALPDTYVRVEGTSTDERPLEDEEFYQAARSLAPTLARELGMDVFTSIAVQSSEMQAVNEALNAGSQGEDLVAGPPLIHCETFEEDPKAWWKFWR